MNQDRVIAVRNAKTIYRDGDRCLKVFNAEYSKADVAKIFRAIDDAVADARKRFSKQETAAKPFSLEG